jgi:hypothetical protein
MGTSIYDLISVSEAEAPNSPVILEDIKPIMEIYQELQASNVTSLLSFHAGVKFSHILNKLSTAIAVQPQSEDENADVADLDDALTESERSFIYGIYLIR